ncbi:Adaptor protein complex AP-3 delta subunit [Rickenella mellea]|uniref:AP-3 complex subunit delta n=1 Tax=Rickenella mellea TaxID=50990 RepID=A0A4Y7Q0Z7_9AGAM|nr:Adaptor protein complex AP-3 delta subunit [Rickenella mellea]
MWERNLQDLIRGLRASKKDESKFIAKAMDEIRQEVRTKDMELKAAAVLKLTYLEMMGYDMSWASFYVVEVMSSPRFHLKSMGYLAAAQSFEQDTDVLMLTTNLLKKDLTAATPSDVAVALNGLSQIVTPDLGRDMTPTLIAMLNHSRANIRKRAVLAFYKVVLKYPEALELGFSRLKEKLEDPDPGVLCATVNVFCELSRQNPRDYLSLAPQLFHIMTTSSNNWMLIKIIKLFGVLCPHEPRLVKKLLPPITDLISTTPAISLLYECVHTCIIGGMLEGASGYSLAKTCVTKLAAFLEDSDQNLKYIALLALVKIVPSHPHLLAEYESRILTSIDDQDLSIRMRALDLISAMVNRDNLQSIVQQLLSHLAMPDSSLGTTVTAAQSLQSAPGRTTTAKNPMSPTQSTSYRTTLASRILQIASADVYANVTDFEWYLSVLFDLAYVAKAPVGPAIRDQLVDVSIRVPQVRRYAVSLSVKLLGDDTFIDNGRADDDVDGSGCQEVLWAGALLCGEFCEHITDVRKVLAALLQPPATNLSPEIISVYLQSAAKIFSHWAADCASHWVEDLLPDVKELVEFMVVGVTPLTASSDIEVQERAANILQLFGFIRADLAAHRPKPAPQYVNGFADPSTAAFDPAAPDAEPLFPKSMYLLHPLFKAYALNPVAPEAQASIPIPEGLDLDAWIVPQARSVADGGADDESDIKGKKKEKRDKKGKGKEKAGGSKNGKPKASEDAAGPSEDRRAVEAELARVRTYHPSAIVESLTSFQLKAKRLEEMRDDPYYIFDDRLKRNDFVDIDSIPVVRLDGLPPLSQDGDSPHRVSTPPSISRPRTPQPQYTIIRDGEMPTSSTAATTPPASTETTPSLLRKVTSDRPVAPPALSSFPPYDADVDVPRTSTPDPIKVTRVKKATGKKKRTKDVTPAEL